MPPGFRLRVIAVVGALRPGQVVSYGDVAAEAGYPGAGRGVGAVLAHADEGLPWWRVVTRDGRLVPGLEAEHARRLRAEGVVLVAGRVPAPGSAARGGGGRSRMLSPMGPHPPPDAPGDVEASR